MEAAAKTVQLLAQRILPEEPHHVSFHPDWRHRPSSSANANANANANAAGRPARFDEWHNTRLQYLTFVSDADRGVLLTRPDYDMREEIAKPAVKEVASLAKTGEKKKLSLSDYKKKSTTTTATATPTTGAGPTSPPEPAMSKRNENERSSSALKPPSDSRRSSDSRNAELPRSKDRTFSGEAKSQRPREPVVDMKCADSACDWVVDLLTRDRLPPKPPVTHPLPPRPPTPDSKKRSGGHDDDFRPQKRSRPDATRSFDERPVHSRDRDEPRRKDRDFSSSRDARDGKSSSSSSLLNGKSSLKDSLGSSARPSPHASHSRGNSLNGIRTSAGGNGSNRNTPSRLDTSSKSSVPPLLSPLHLDIDQDDDSSAERKKRKREEALDAPRSVNSSKKADPPPPPKRNKSPARLPPLLSPTLPPEVEAELARIKKSPPKVADAKSRDDREPLPTKKSRADLDDDDERGPPPRRKELVVTLKVPKRRRQDFRRILALPPRRDRNPSSDAQARKRPSSTADSQAEPTATKRPRTSELSSSSRLPAPSTPSKKGTAAMSRVSSNNSIGNTPGAGPGATPSGPATYVNGQADQLDVPTLREREQRFIQLGKRLKHDGDELMNTERSGANGGGKASGEANVKLAHVITLESIIAFMAGFQAQNRHRALARKPTDPSGWASMFPLLEQRRPEMRRHPPLFAILVLLHAMALDEAVKCYWTFGDPGAQVKVNDIAKHERARARALTQLRETLAGIESSALRLEVYAWSTVDEVSESCLRVMRRYCVDEDVEWRPEVNLR